MKPKHFVRLAALSLGLSPALALAQTPLPPSAPATRQAAPDALRILDISHGFGQLLPHRIHELDAQGLPTSTIFDIRELGTLIDNHSATNGVLPVVHWPSTATLPGGAAGNQFLVVRFEGAVDLDTLLTASPSASANSQLLGSLTVVAVNPLNGQRTPVQGRAFVGGETYAGMRQGNPPMLPRQTWVTTAGSGVAANPGVDNDNDGIADGLGFPGTEAGTSFAGDTLLALPNAFVFVADTDGDLLTHESFPAAREITVELSTDIFSATGLPLEQAAFANATVGADTLSPELRFTPAPPNPLIIPGNGEQNVDPMTTVTAAFTESVRPGKFGTLTGAGLAGAPLAMQLEFGPAGLQTSMPFTVLPISAWDFSRMVLTPAYAFPGGGQTQCGNFGLVNVRVNPLQVQDFVGNLNVLTVASFFETGPGQGIANAPVAPDAIYVGRLGARVGISVIDLNGFGGSSGNPAYDQVQVIEGNSNYPNNPNLRFQGSVLRPPLAPGGCTVDGGSAGVFTTTKDSNLDDLLASSPLLQGASEMVLGAPLDLLFNNGPAPFGCQAGGGNLCALDAVMLLDVSQGGPSTLQPTSGSGSLHMAMGAGNPISFAPHPNPPPLVFPPLCVSPSIGGQEPTSVDTSALGLSNLLFPGDPFGLPAQGIPPSGLLTPEQNSFFEGPSLPAVQISACAPFQQRQQVGQFLYVVDRPRNELVILNSNRMQTIDRIALADPTELAMAPNLDFLAVTNQATGTVDFIDTNPASATFHEVVQSTAVGASPSGIAWDSGNEDILVCNEGDGSVSVISAFSLAVRKVLTSQLTQPFAIALTPRQAGFGYQRNVYFGYIMNRSGSCAIFESGPDGGNGWGYDDIIGRAPYVFREPKALQVDPTQLTSGIWIAHEGEIDTQTGQAAPAGTGAASRLRVQSSLFGQEPLTGAGPNFRSLSMNVDISLGQAVLTGIPIDLALDDQRNFGALAGVSTPFGAGVPATINSKGLVRNVGGTRLASTNPHSLFLAVPNPVGIGTSVVDVIDTASLLRRDTNAFQPGVQSIPMPGVVSLGNYFD